MAQRPLGGRAISFINRARAAASGGANIHTLAGLEQGAPQIRPPPERPEESIIGAIGRIANDPGEVARLAAQSAVNTVVSGVTTWAIGRGIQMGEEIIDSVSNAIEDLMSAPSVISDSVEHFTLSDADAITENLFNTPARTDAGEGGNATVNFAPADATTMDVFRQSGPSQCLDLSGITKNLFGGPPVGVRTMVNFEDDEMDEGYSVSRLDCILVL